MSGKGGGSSNNGAGVQSIPAASRKMVQSLKEIVPCPEQEIYSMLKECNMDPNEAVNRLLSQDPFHEVRSKREKKKENKDTTEPWSRGVSSSSNRGGRGATDRHIGRSSSNQYSASESGGKTAHKKENGTNAFTISSSSVSAMAGSNAARRAPVPSDSVTTDSKGSTVGIFDGISSSPSGYQPAWLGVPGQLSMADIVKMGKPHGKTPTTNPFHQSVNNHHVQAPQFTAVHNDLPSSDCHVSKVSEMHHESGITGQNISPIDEWPLVEQPPAASVPTVLGHSADLHPYGDSSNLHYGKSSQQFPSQADEISTQEDGSSENNYANHAHSRSVEEDDFGGSSLSENDLPQNMGNHQPHRQAFEHQEVEDAGDSVSSMTANLQQLSIAEEHALHEEDQPSVVIPDHLQVQSADCMHLSFGSFGSCISAAFKEPYASRPSKSNMEAEPVEADDSTVGHSDTRNAEYYGDEPLKNSSEGNTIHIAGANAGNYDPPSASQPEVMRQENPEASHVHQYNFPSSAPGYTFDNAQQLSTGISHSQTSSQMQNHAQFSNVVQAYTNSLPSTLLAPSVPPVREPDLPYSPFPLAAQSLPTKYNHTTSSISSSALSMAEVQALKAASFASTQSSPQSQQAALPQHLAVHPYSQQALPLGPFSNIMGYPFMPQSYTYMPSAFQQAFAGNSTYHQSLAAAAALPPQYKNSNLPHQSAAAIASGYGGGFGSSTSIPGNFPMNTPPTAPAGTTYDDILSSQYKDTSHLISLQQNENSGMWIHGGPGSRTMSAVPASTYYSLMGQQQNQQVGGGGGGGYRQGQQQQQTSLQNYNNPPPPPMVGGYHANYYHTQSGIPMDHQQQQMLQQQQQQQNSRGGDGSSSVGGGSQGQQQQPSKQQQSQQLWQSSY